MTVAAHPMAGTKGTKAAKDMMDAVRAHKKTHKTMPAAAKPAMKPGMKPAAAKNADAEVAPGDEVTAVRHLIAKRPPRTGY